MTVLSIDRPRADSGAEPRVSRRQSRIPGKDSVARTNSVRLAWRLTGRSEELRVIAAALADPHVSGVVVRGAAGVGKSRVAREALNSAASAGWESRWIAGGCAARAVPLGALTPWTGPAVGSNFESVRGVMDALTAVPSGAPLILGVDNADLLDDLSTFVVHQIVQRGAAKVVLTICGSAPIPAATLGIWSEPRFHRLDLAPLSYDQTAMLTATALGGAVDPDVAGRLWRLTRGNVLYLRHIVEQEVAERRLVRKDGCWRWIGEPVVPPDLAEIIECRIGTLPTPVGDVLDALSVGEPIDVRSLARITAPAAVEEADRRGLITVESVDGALQARLAHPIYGEVRRRRAAPMRQRRLRGLVAAELGAGDDRDDIRMVVRRAALTLDSDTPPDPGLLVHAAQGALWLVDLPLVDRLAAAAIRASGGTEAKFIRSEVLMWLGSGQQADTVLADVGEDGLTDTDRARLAFLRAANTLLALADRPGAKRLIDEAGGATAAPAARACLDAFLTLYWAMLGRPLAAVESAKHIVPAQLPDAIAAHLTAWATVVAHGDAGRDIEALPAVETGTRVVTRSFVISADARVAALLLQGRIGDALDAAEWLSPSVADLAADVRLLGAGVAGCAALGAGRLGEACALLGPVVDGLTTAGDPVGWRYRYALARTIGLAMRGSAEDAVAALADAEQRRHPGWCALDYELARARAWVAACQGEVTLAIAILASAAATARQNGQLAAEVLCLQTGAQFGSPSGGSRLHELAGLLVGPRVHLAARFVAALDAGDAPGLGSVSIDFEKLGDLIAALDAAAHAAIVCRQRGERGSALGHAARAQALAERCGAVTPALRQAAGPLPLTTREREVVMMIGAGRSNRDIAARLTLSIRTVEGHIYRAMTKTGATSRAQLAAMVPGSTCRSLTRQPA